MRCALCAPLLCDGDGVLHSAHTHTHTQRERERERERDAAPAYASMHTMCKNRKGHMHARVHVLTTSPHTTHTAAAVSCIRAVVRTALRSCVRCPAQTRRRKRPIAEQPPLRRPEREFLPSFLADRAYGARDSAWRAYNGATRSDSAAPVRPRSSLQHFQAKSSSLIATSPPFSPGGARAAAPP